MSVWLYSTLSTSRLRVREDEVYMQLLNQNILYISRLRVQKDSIITCRDRVWGMPHYSVCKWFTSARSESRFRVHTLVQREMFLKRCATVNRLLCAFPSPPGGPKWEDSGTDRVCQVQKSLCCEYRASKHAWLPSQTAFTTLALPRPYHPNSPPLLSRHLVWCKSMRRSLW